MLYLGVEILDLGFCGRSFHAGRRTLRRGCVQDVLIDIASVATSNDRNDSVDCEFQAGAQAARHQ
jgi:hypothetical protein